MNFLITIITLTVFSIDNKASQYRLQSTFTILLSAISLKWTILNRAMPAISYLTILDSYQILSITFICLIAIWHSIDSSLLYIYKLDKYMLSFFSILFLFKHLFFIGWIYIVNKKKRELAKKEHDYFSKHKDHFLPNENI